jgi:hypothetical protein
MTPPLLIVMIACAINDRARRKRADIRPLQRVVNKETTNGVF